jgi:hypothetical protein
MMMGYVVNFATNEREHKRQRQHVVRKRMMFRTKPRTTCIVPLVAIHISLLGEQRRLRFNLSQTILIKPFLKHNST